VVVEEEKKPEAEEEKPAVEASVTAPVEKADEHRHTSTLTGNFITSPDGRRFYRSLSSSPSSLLKSLPPYLSLVFANGGVSYRFSLCTAASVDEETRHRDFITYLHLHPIAAKCFLFESIWSYRLDEVIQTWCSREGRG
jgi:hypothetical protein